MRVSYAFLLFVGITLLILPTAIVTIKTSAQFSMFNPRWDGCSEFAKLLNERGSVVPLMYPYNSIGLGGYKGILVIVGPNMEFSPLEAEEVKIFLENGGTLFLADDFGTGNSLLEKLGINTRFSKEPLKDLFYSKKSEFPVVVRIEEPELAVGVDKLILNVPSVIVSNKGEILSSKVSIVGKNMRSYPILVELKYKRGKIILLSDPSILINDMSNYNRRFIVNLIDYIGSGTFYFDESHHYDFNPYSVTTAYIHRELDREKAFQVFIVVSALAILIESGIINRIIKSISRIFSKKEEELVKDLPEWVDIALVERIVSEIKTGTKLGDRYGWKRVYNKLKE